MTPGVPARARRPTPLVLLGAAALGATLLVLLPGEAGPLAARATLAVAALGALAVSLRRRAPDRAAPALRVTARAGLGRAGLVAVVEVDGRRFLLGSGERSVELLAELEPIREVRP